MESKAARYPTCAFNVLNLIDHNFLEYCSNNLIFLLLIFSLPGGFWGCYINRYIFVFKELSFSMTFFFEVKILSSSLCAPFGLFASTLIFDFVCNFFNSAFLFPDFFLS